MTLIHYQGPSGGAAPAKRSDPAPGGGVAPAAPAYVFLAWKVSYAFFFVFFTGLFTLTFKGSFHFFLFHKFSSQALSRIFRRVKKTVSWLKFLEIF